MTDRWPNARPDWCPHPTCLYLRRSQDAGCVGALPSPEEHDGVPNTHRLCIGPSAEAQITDIQLNAADADYLRYLVDAIDGKRTSWRSRR